MAAAAGPNACLRCGGVLEVGYLLDKDRQSSGQAQWVSGEPDEGFWGMKTKGRDVLPVTARRCRACGGLDLRASKEG